MSSFNNKHHRVKEFIFSVFTSNKVICFDVNLKYSNDLRVLKRLSLYLIYFMQQNVTVKTLVISFGLRNVFMYKYLIVSCFFFSSIGFWSGNLF